jgi:uncharacterized membrane protein YkvA (DUF1232 family)
MGSEGLVERTSETHILIWFVLKGPIMAEFDAARAQLPQVMSRNEETVRAGFWPKLKRVLSRVPFAEDAVAAWYCAFDPQTPLKVRGMLLAALAYFVMPIDVVPDMLLGLGFTDDLTVLMTAVALIGTHLRPEHRRQAQQALARLRDEEPDLRT